MVDCLLFPVLVVLVVAFFPTCALVIGGAGVLGTATAVDSFAKGFYKYGWIPVVGGLAIGVVLWVFREDTRADPPPGGQSSGYVHRIERQRL